MLGKMAIPFKVSCVLVHRNVNNTVEYSENLVLGLQSLLELQILVPERVGEKIEANTSCASLIEPMRNLLVGSLCKGGEKHQERGRGQQT